jgi:magnesium-transporting ATPase (P-type)
MDQQSGTSDSRAWHALKARQTLDALHSSLEGLAAGEAAQRLEKFGYNRLPAPAARNPLLRLLAQFNNLLILVLIGAAVVTALLDHWVDTWVILGVVIVNALIGFVQEGRAEQALEAIRHMLAPNASVSRDGRRHTLPAEELVPGDIVLLEPGDKVPADIRLLKIKGLRVQEAILTGESVPVDKTVDPVGETADLGDRRSMAYSGTLIAAGQGIGVVVGTGARTEIGRISDMLTEVETLTTPLLRQMAIFARRLTLVILCIAAAIFFYGLLWQGQDVTAMFMTVVGLAVAAIPEGLPAILSVTLAIGVQRMAARNAIIRRLPTVETLGAVSIICSDKTGTLTRNEMTVRSVAVSGQVFATSGTGYDPHGEYLQNEAEVEIDDHPQLLEMLRAGALCNDSALRHHEDLWQVTGDPMEGALLVAAMKGGLEIEQEHRQFPRTDVIPFDAAHRFMAVLCHDHEGNGYIFVKGAPEQILDMCRLECAPEGERPLNRERWREHIDEIAAQGQRVLAVAQRRVPGEQRNLEFADVTDQLTLLGLFGLLDPPREEAVSAIAECQSAGIRVKMITGDHAATAIAIARQLGLANHDEVVTGRELDTMDADTLADTAMRVDVFARTTPEHKLRLVEAMQARGEVIAMTGDGVNDSPALKRADVGVAMGRNGTEAAKEASEMVLADDNFVSIAQAVREGRTVYDNLKKSILFLLPVNGGESLGILVAVLTGMTLPITPLQILWVNMVSSVGLAMALAFEPPEPDIMQRPPRPRDEPILSRFLIWRIMLVSVLFVAGVFTMFYWPQLNGATLEEARTYAVNTLVVMEIFYLFNVRYLGSGSLAWQRMLGTRPVWIALSVVVTLQLIFTYAPFMERLFDTRPVDFTHGLEIIAIGMLLFAVLEVEKMMRRKKQD